MTPAKRRHIRVTARLLALETVMGLVARAALPNAQSRRFFARRLDLIPARLKKMALPDFPLAEREIWIAEIRGAAQKLVAELKSDLSRP